MKKIFAFALAWVLASSCADPKEKIGVQLWTFRLFNMETALAKADSAGVKNVEAFEGQLCFGDTLGVRMSAESIRLLKNDLQKKGIRMRSAFVGAPATPEAWQQIFAFAKTLGLEYITVEPLREHWDLIEHLGSEYNIKIALHNHPKGASNYWHPDSVLAAVKGRPHIGACADLGHWARSGLDVVSCLQKLKGHILGIHIKDINADAEDVPVSTGVLNYQPVIKELQQQSFTGMMIIEREGNWENNVPDVALCAAFLREQLTRK